MEPLDGKRVPIRDILSHREEPAETEASRKPAAEIPRRAAKFLAQKTETVLSNSRVSGANFFRRYRNFYPGLFEISKWKIILGAILLVSAGAVVFSVFSSVTVAIAERTESAHIDTVVTVGNGADIAAESISVEDAAVASGKSSGAEDVANRASGRIVVYNNYGADSQPLVRRTRFATPDGKIFRLQESVTVPGATMVDGKLKPGELEADVVADQPGDAYNIDLVDFTIPGFSGSAKYAKFYARSKTPMSGGFIGRATVVREEDAAAVQQSLERDLKNKLSVAFAAKLGEGFVIPDGALRYDISVKSVEPAVGARGDTFEVRLAGTLAGLAVKRADVEHVLAIKYGKEPAGTPPKIKNFDALLLKADKSDFEKKTMTLTVKGDSDFVWQAPVEDLKQKLIAAAGAAGRNAVFASYPQIRQASVSYHPSWWRFFPKQEGKINVQESAAPENR